MKIIAMIEPFTRSDKTRTGKPANSANTSTDAAGVKKCHANISLVAAKKSGER